MHELPIDDNVIRCARLTAERISELEMFLAIRAAPARYLKAHPGFAAFLQDILDNNWDGDGINGALDDDL